MDVLFVVGTGCYLFFGVETKGMKPARHAAPVMGVVPWPGQGMSHSSLGLGVAGQLCVARVCGGRCVGGGGGGAGLGVAPCGPLR